jgi:hypothetical protein
MRLPNPPRDANWVPWASDLVQRLGIILEHFDKNKLSYSRHFSHRSVDAGMTAAGSLQENATEIATDLAEITNGAGAGVRLPDARPGRQITIANRTAGTINVYPSTGESIDALAANAAFSVATTKTAVLTCMVAGKWYSLTGA